MVNELRRSNVFVGGSYGANFICLMFFYKHVAPTELIPRSIYCI
jgi:hypothetical protein